MPQRRDETGTNRRERQKRPQIGGENLEKDTDCEAKIDNSKSASA